MSSELQSSVDEIYCSDGLPPIPPPIAPVISISSNETSDGKLDSGDAVTLVQAFEVFSGKIFIPQEKVLLHADPIKESFPETTLQRMARLRMEVSELEKDLESTASFSESLESGTSYMKLGKDVLQDLSERLAKISNEKGLKSTEDIQSDLTSSISRELELMKKAQQRNETGEKENSKEKESFGVTYELYPSLSSGGNDKTLHNVSIEDRLSRIENVLGATTDLKPNGSILKKLEEIEKMAKNVDTKSLDAALSRAKIIRSDLEAGSKYRSKLPLPPEDSKTISILYDQMQKVDGISDQLPTLVDRLSHLSNLHSHAADFATRLVVVENSTSDIERMLQKFDEILNKVEDGCKKNVELIEESVKNLDERMNALKQG